MDIITFIVLLIADGFAIAGGLIMVISGVGSFVRFIKGNPWSIDKPAINQIEKIRLGFGHKIIFSLEFLILSDVLQTLVNQERTDLISLGGIVIIRTILSYFISKELAEFHKD